MSTTPKLFLALSGALAIAAPVTASAAILLNEIHLRTPASDGVNVQADKNYEFVELRSTTGGEEPCTDMWILIIDNEGGSVGEIKQAWPLKKPDGTPMRTGTNGLLLLGDDYTSSGSPWEGAKSPQTLMGDPSGMSPDNIPDSDAVTILLVTGYTNPPVPPGADADIDVDNDGVGIPDWLEVPVPAGGFATPLWTAVVDSVGFNGDQGNVIKRAYTADVANLSRSNAVTGVPRLNSALNFYPYTLARNASNNTASSRDAWYGGKLSGASSAVDSVTYSVESMNLSATPAWVGLATPGQPNFSGAPVAPIFRINEINANPPGTPGHSPDNAGLMVANDGTFEYVEIINTTANQAGGTNFSGSLNNYTLLVIDSGGPLTGEVLEAWSLGRFATGSNSLLVLGDNYSAGVAPFAAGFDPLTQLADPAIPVVSPDAPAGRYSSLGRGDIPNNGVTFMLVLNWTGAVGTTDLDGGNAGTIDIAPLPYSAVVDSVSIPEVSDTGALVANRLGYSPARPDISVGAIHNNADNLSRLPGNAITATASWAAGAFGSEDSQALAYRNGHFLPATFRGAASPGRANYSAAPAAGTLRLNEVHVNPPTATDNTEYVEVISSSPFAPMTNCWLVVLDASSSNSSGRVQKIIDLRGQNTGANRLAIFADGIEEATNVLVPYSSARTVRDDPAYYNSAGTKNDTGAFNFTPDSLQNDGVSVLLVSYAPTTPAGLPATQDTDLDANNDGVLDSAPAWTLIDGISTGNGIGGVPVLGSSPATTGSVSRLPGNLTANSPAAWTGGELAGNTATSFAYGATHFGAFTGAASPGRHNVTAPISTSASLLLNEVNINPPGGDNDKEFIEMLSSSGSSISTVGYSILLIDNEGADTGRVQKVFDLDSAATGPNGLLLAGVGYDTSVPWTAAAAPAAATRLYFPEGMAFDDIGLSTDNGALTILLAKNFTGRVGDDLDEGLPADGNAADDHIFNTQPWEAISDSVAMKTFRANPAPPPAYILDGHIFPGTADLSQPIPAAPNEANGYTPDTVARFGGVLTPNSRAAWYGANLAGTAGTSTAYDASQFFPSNLNGGKVTPGQANIIALTDTSDPDGDGVPHLIEEALGMNDFAADNYKLPQPAYLSLPGVYAGRKQPVFVVVRPTGGVPGLTYTVEASTDLTDWSLAINATQVVLVNTDPNMETRTYYLRSGGLAEADAEGRVYFRLRVERP